MSPKQSRPGGGTSPDPTEETMPGPGRRPPAVVGIGASAGGLDAFSRLLEALPTDTGMAFVLVQHLDPKHESLLTLLLSSRTGMPVREATDGLELIGDHVYVGPSEADLLIAGGRLHLTPREPEAGHHLPIDGFLRSLAADAGEQAIGVILSGAASDGAKGLEAIKSAGGVTFAQEPATAEYSSMPASAIGARVVDFVLAPEAIAVELARLAGSSVDGAEPRLPEGEDEGAGYERAFALLQDAFRVDFSAYKLPTIRRRVARRMIVRRTADLDTYLGLLADDPAEVEALYRDLLIMVTEFFRDPEAFAVLRERVFPAILRERGDDGEVRLWVAGCASGEEAYSLAITLLEVMSAQRLERRVKVFATDISEPDLATARRGIYGESIAGTVAPGLLQRYFVHTDGGYQISKAVRELCVFARHDVTSDPPFANLDLVSCRNLLIYLGAPLQRWVISSLHYGLRRDGYLLLGRSESLGRHQSLFETIDAKQKIFRKLSPAAVEPQFRYPGMLRQERTRKPIAPAEASPTAQPRRSLTQQADAAVLAAVGPPGVTVDGQHAIVEFRGDVRRYLQIRPGRASLDLLDMVREELRGKVRAALAEAERTGTTAALRSIAFGKGKARRSLDLRAVPFRTAAGEAHYVVLFDESLAPAVTTSKTDQAEQVERGETELLREELSETRERLEALVQEKEAANEELSAANEEMLSSGEEMQSVNEELETTHEELTSTNQELRSRNLELGEVSDDLTNLLASVSFPIIMVGRDLRIRRFTPAAARLLKVLATDVGRPIGDLRLHIDVPDLEELLGEVIETMALTERDVRDDQGRWYAMQVRPFKTLDNRIDGAVLTLFDIDEAKRMFADQKSIATTLQQQYVHPLPEIAGLELAVVAETAHHRELVGGDVHDVFRLPDGKVLVLIGDVAGKGVEAAGLAETVRVAARATALVSPSPPDILRTIHRLVVDDDSDEFVTALVLTLDPSSGEVTLASAGHLPPLHISAAGCAFVEPEYGCPLGTLESDYPTRRFLLASGDTLVLYTDGLVEARRGGELFGEERLMAAFCGDGRGDVQALVERARRAVTEFAAELRDDLQILAVRLT